VSETTRTDIPSQIKLRYLRSNYFRVIHADGVFGGFTPQGNIFPSLFSDRAPLPDVTIHAGDAGGVLGKELLDRREVSNETVTRELEVGISMNLNVAKSLLEWLKERIEIGEKAQAELSQREGAEKK